MVWKSVNLPQESVLIFTCGPNPFDLDNTYSHFFPLVLISITVQDLLLVQVLSINNKTIISFVLIIFFIISLIKCI